MISEAAQSFAGYINAIGRTAVRWNIEVSKETGVALRTYQSSQGAKTTTYQSHQRGPCTGACFMALSRTSRHRDTSTDPDELPRTSSTAPSTKFAKTPAPPSGNREEPDARRARHQHSHFRPDGISNGHPGGESRDLAGRLFFTLLTFTEQLDELRATLGGLRSAERITPYARGACQRMMDKMKETAKDVERAPARPALHRSTERFSPGPVRSRQGGLSGDRR